MGDASKELGTGVDCADSYDCGGGLGPREADRERALCAAFDGRLGAWAAFLLYLDVGTLVLRVKDIDERADAGTGIVGNCISSTLGTELPGIMKTFSSRVTVLVAVAPVVLAPLLEVALSPDTLDELAACLLSG